MVVLVVVLVETREVVALVVEVVVSVLEEVLVTEFVVLALELEETELVDVLVATE